MFFLPAGISLFEGSINTQRELTREGEEGAEGKGQKQWKLPREA